MNDMADAVRAVPTAGWRARLHCALETYTKALSEEPDVARLFLLDVLGARPRAIDLRREVLGRFVDQLKTLRAVAAHEDPALEEVPDALLRALVGGINELVTEHIHHHGAASLPEIAPTLEDLAHAILERSRLSARA